jgi:hypothetical protein
MTTLLGERRSKDWRSDAAIQPEFRSRKKGRIAPGLVGIGIDA